MDKYLEQIEYFFDTDMEMKKLLVSVHPSEMDESSDEARIKYFDKLYKALEIVDSRLGKFVNGPFFNESQFWDEHIEWSDNGGPERIERVKSNVPNAYRQKMELLKKQLMKCESLNIPLDRTYNACFANMSSNLIRDVKDKIKGVNNDEQAMVEELIGESATINEILHVLHTHVTNNQEIFNALPVIAKKEPASGVGDGSILVGDPSNDLARELFEKFELPNESRFAYTVALKDRTMMMVRDVGHALTMQILEQEDGNVKVDYYIPKITDFDIVEHLPALQQDVDYETQTASGMLIIPRNEAAERISSFIGMVPGDIQPISGEMIRKLISVRGDEEKAMQLVQEGMISPRNMLLRMYTNMADIDVTPQFKKRLLDMADELEVKGENKRNSEDEREL